MKILIVKLGSIGDIVHTLPALAAIRNALPDAEISWAAERRSAEILRGNPHINHLIEVDTRALRTGKLAAHILPEARRQFRAVRNFKYDIALDFQGLLKSAVIAKISGAPRRIGFDADNLREPASRFLLTETVHAPPKQHIIRKNLILAEGALNISVPAADYEFPIAADLADWREAAAITEQVGENFAVLNPAGGWTTKLWRAEKFGALADKIWEQTGMMSVVATAPNETELAARVAAASKSGSVFLAQPSLKGFYELVRKTRIYVGGDTGPTHLAAAAGAPLIGIFGPTEWWRNGSPNPLDICVERTDIGCRVNCHRRTCSNWICLDISVETVWKAVEKRLQTGRKII